MLSCGSLQNVFNAAESLAIFGDPFIDATVSVVMIYGCWSWKAPESYAGWVRRVVRDWCNKFISQDCIWNCMWKLEYIEFFARLLSESFHNWAHINIWVPSKLSVTYRLFFKRARHSAGKEKKTKKEKYKTNHYLKPIVDQKIWNSEIILLSLIPQYYYQNTLLWNKAQ